VRVCDSCMVDVKRGNYFTMRRYLTPRRRTGGGDRGGIGDGDGDEGGGGERRGHARNHVADSRGLPLVIIGGRRRHDPRSHGHRGEDDDTRTRACAGRREASPRSRQHGRVRREGPGGIARARERIRG
jgi:hypothetical protein